MIRLQFMGGAETVTGSKYLVQAHGKNILVDCGLFQGLKSLRNRNWEAFSIRPEQIDAVILTHAHIDHSGYIPRLIKDGFRGKVFATPATKDLCQILLPDAGFLAEEEATYLNKHKRTKHQPALPLFTFEDGQKALSSFSPIPFDQNYELDQQIAFQFHYAGHILGAASVVLNISGTKIGFSGDIGRPNDEIFYPPRLMPSVHYLVTESTYGNRLHKDLDPLDLLEKIIHRTWARKGTVIIPSFAVGRAQSLLFYLWKLKEQKRIPDIPIYLNSPMATDVNEVWIRHHGQHRLTQEQCRQVCGIATYVRTMEDSVALNESTEPKIIISASGMISGGRVLHHIKRFGPDPKNTIILAGFQSAGTRGEAIQNGADEIKIHGEYILIKAEVALLENMSAHADYKEMTDLYRQSNINPIMVFITHGEPSASDELRRRLSESLGWKCVVPSMGQIMELNSALK